MKTMNKVVMTLAGLLLIVASILKIHEMLTLPIPGWKEGGPWESYEFFLVQIPLELSLGIWLVSGLFRKAAWLVGTLCFLGFIGVTAYKMYIGAESCGCFGQVHVKPWITLSFIDIPFFLLLAIWWPGKDYKLLPPPWPNVFHAIVFAAPIFATLIFAAPAMVAFKPIQIKPGDIDKVKVKYIVKPCDRPHADDPEYIKKLTDTIRKEVESQLAQTQVTVPENTTETTPDKTEPNKIEITIPIPQPDPNTKPVEPVTPVPNTEVKLSAWLDQIDIADQLKQGIVVVLMYHHDCPTCATMVPKYDQYYSKMKELGDDSMTLAYIAIPPYSDKGPIPADTLCLKGKLKEKETKGEIWAITSPYVIALINGEMVKEWKQGTAPEPETLMDEIFSQP
ncbi:MAG: MauE/DoxX family redox-associated membrane protein [Anaerohalosphaeraceae bacterium]